MTASKSSRREKNSRISSIEDDLPCRPQIGPLVRKYCAAEGSVAEYALQNAATQCQHWSIDAVAEAGDRHIHVTET